MKTVPPAGVRLLAANEKTPKHQLVTNYKYNSLGQLVEQTSPDGGTTNFYYNHIGQLRYSLNDKQRAEGKYSYTAYDALGRVIEVGQSSFEYTPDLSGPLSNIETLSIPPTGNEYVTRTTYNTAVTGLEYPAIGTNGVATPQRYLTNRVSSTFVSGGARTSYSYDPHGNVEWLAQDVPGLPRKFVRYEYDLISNKVTQVAYQEGQADQFFHRYRYDDDNRLLAVQTSADGQVWEQDAQYEYYAHGPLKRLVLGDDQVQALDYAYTLQGWLKGVNHPNLSKNLTAGQAFSLAADGDGSNNGVAADAFGMTLGYYAGDYVRAGSYLNEAAGTTAAKGVLAPTAAQNLYNGNIATWTTRSLENTAADPSGTSPTAGETYRYDQLNRLLESARSTANGSNLWTSNNRYATSYSYDANGNLQTLTRRANSNALLDNLTYHYKPTADNKPTNRLLSVSDAVKDNLSAEDVDDQPDVDNYDYDKVGNLIRDKQAGVTSISWTPYGKIAQVQRPGALTTSYLYDAQGNRIRKVLAPVGRPKTTYYVRDAQGNPLAIYEALQGDAPQLVEQPLYGSARLGERKPAAPLSAAPPVPGVSGATYARVLGQKLYELSDHLGNVRAVVTDEKTSTLSASTGKPLTGSLQPVLSAYYNYYAFGQLQPGRYSAGNTGAGGYRYGYNGKEKDNNGELGLTNYDYGFRIYNPGLGRFLSVDPLTSSYPWYTPYQFAGNTPIWAVDLDGLEEKIVTQSVGRTTTAILTKQTEGKVVDQVIKKSTSIVFDAGKIVKIKPTWIASKGLGLFISFMISPANGDDNSVQQLREFTQHKADASELRRLELLAEDGRLSFQDEQELEKLSLRVKRLTPQNFITVTASVIKDAENGVIRSSAVVNYYDAIEIGKKFVGDRYTTITRERADGTTYIFAYESEDKTRRFRLPVEKQTTDPTTGKTSYNGRTDANLEIRQDPNVSWGNGAAVKRGERN